MRKILTGLLCVFAAVAAEAVTLPSGYMAVEYIESTKGGGQYINTWYVHKENTKIVCEVNASSQLGSQSGSAAVFGACKGNQLANAFVFYAKDSFGAVCYQRDAQEDTGEGHTFPCDVRTTITCVRQLAMWSDSGDNKTIYIPMDKVEGGICPLLIFDKNTATDTGVRPEGSAAVMRLYSFKIYEDEALVHDFVPCVQEGTGKAGLYDVIGGGFHGNAGTGADFQRAMPSGYMAVEYIESTVGGNQYINTEYTSRRDTKVVCRLLNNGSDTSKDFGALFGSRFGYDQTRGMFLWLRYLSKNAPSYGRAGVEYSLKGSDFPFGEITTVTCQGATCSWNNDAGTKPNSITLTNCKEDQYDGVGPLLIFAINSSSTEGGCNPTDHLGFRLYSFKIYEGEKLERDFVPCIEKATGKMGLYDIVKFRFYSNAGNKEDFPRTLPRGFVSIDCIESTGLERIDTGYKCLSGTKIDCSIQVASSQPKDYSAVFGSRNRVYWTDSYEFHVRWDGKNEPIYLRNSEKKGGGADDFPYDQRVALTCQGKTATWTWGGNSKTLTVDNEPCDCVNPLMIFDVNRDGYGGSSAEGNSCVMRLYSFRIFEGEAVKRNFMPCIETATGKAGLYDIVEGNFHGNTGTGAFRFWHHVADIPYWDPVAKSNVVVSCEKVLPETSSFEDGRWYAVMDSVTCGSIVVNGSVNLILMDGCSFTSNGGIQVDLGKSFTVYGQAGGTGTLTANGGSGRAGIGGVNLNAWGGSGSYGDITINGGVVNVKGGDGPTLVSVDWSDHGSAGIGGAMDNKDGGTVTIHGGTVTAVGGNAAPGIGGGRSYNPGNGNSGPVIIDGGAVDVRPGSYGGGAIGSGRLGKTGPISVSGGIFASKTDPSWLVPSYICVANTDSQTSVKYPWKVIWGVQYINEKGETCVTDGLPTVVDGSTTIFDAGWYVVTGRVECGTITVNGSVNLILADGCSLTSNGGIQVDPDRSFTVYGQTGGTGMLTATGGSGRAGIGGVNLNAWEGYGSYGDITINGGVVNVKGGDGPAIGPWKDDGSAGIGGAMDNEDGGTVTIHGGTVTVVGGINAPGIGGGHSCNPGNGNSGPVIIDGGAVDVRPGSHGGDAIGSGGNGKTGPISISGGVFARKPKEVWIAGGHWISDNCRPGTDDQYPWKVLKAVWVSVRLIKGTGVDELRFHREGETAFVPFPDGGTNLLVGAWIRISVHSCPGYVYVGDEWFHVEESGLNETITSTAFGADGDGSPERPWLVGDSVVAWTNGIGGLAVFGEGPMDDSIDAYGPIWTAFADDITELTVGGDITAIGAGAFAGLANLKKVTVSADQLVTISDYAFADCWSLADLTLPNSVEEIGESAFEYCFDLRSCNLPKSLLAIGARAFFYCWTLTELDLPDSVISIDEQAFAGCSWIERLGLGSGLVWLGDSAFSDCTSIGAIAIRAEEPPFVGDKVFYFVPSSATLTVPAASVDLYKMAEGWKDFDVRPAADPANETNPDATERVPPARLASATLGTVDEKPPFEIVREGDVVRVTVRLPNALPGVLYRLLGSTDLTFANPTEVVRGTAGGADGLELSGTVPAGASCFFKVVVEGGNEE